MNHSRHYYPVLDGLKGLAFLLVFCAHAMLFMKLPFVNSGKEGVFLFFIIFAFLSTLHFQQAYEKKPGLAVFFAYFLRKILRIYPMYFLTLAIMPFTLPYISPYVFLILRPLIFMKQHLLLQVGIEHLWSVPVILKYSVCIPFLVLFYVKFLKKNIAAYGIFSAVVLISYTFLYYRVFNTWKISLMNRINLWPYIPVFFIGSSLSFLVHRYHNVRPKSIRFPNGIIVCLILLFIVSLPYSPYEFLIINTFDMMYYLYLLFYGFIFSALIMVLISSKTLLGSVLQSNYMRYIGKISFSAYLIHYLMFIWVSEFLKPYTYAPGMKILLVFILTIAFSTITYYLIEKPFRDFSKYLTVRFS
jgi:peptidoglycan/LPS O-acetylase OafA/YrhL